MKKLLKLCGIFVLFLSTACDQNSSEDKFRYAGTVETTKVTLSSKVASDIVKFSLEEGDEVKAGDVVVQLNDDIYQVATTQLNNDYERSRKLISDKFISEEEHDRIKRQKDTNDLYIEWCKIKTPISGTVITKFKQEGEYVSPGMNIISITDTKDVWAYFYVEHNEINKFKVGDIIKCYLPELPDKIIVGKIIKINEEAEFTPKNVQTREERTRLVYGIKVKFENDDLLIKSGMVLETSFEPMN